jgi:type II secretory pathway component PulM
MLLLLLLLLLVLLPAAAPVSSARPRRHLHRLLSSAACASRRARRHTAAASGCGAPAAQPAAGKEMISSDILREHGLQLQEQEKAVQAAGPSHNACINCTFS